MKISCHEFVNFTSILLQILPVENKNATKSFKRLTNDTNKVVRTVQKRVRKSTQSFQFSKWHGVSALFGHKSDFSFSISVALNFN